MDSLFSVKNVVFKSGERFPLLVNKCTGVPLFDPTVFTMTELRARNRANTTVEQVLRALKIFVQFCADNGIDLKNRMLNGEVLNLSELDALSDLCRLYIEDIENSTCRMTAEQESSSLRRLRPSAKILSRQVKSSSAGVRLGYISDYVRWLSDRCLLDMKAESPFRSALYASREIILSGIKSRTPSAKPRNNTNSRTALDEAAQTRLWNIINVEAIENPWTGRHTKVRNELIVRWFMGLGIRRGELLGVKISDIDFRSNEVLIKRRANDPTDPRSRQPNAKTAARALPLSEDLARRTREYIIEERRCHRRARKHEFLFVANGGAPLSLRGLNKIFLNLRDRCLDLPNIFPHLFRHTFNFNFSNIADEQNIDPEKEKKIRSQLMGWSETSNTAKIYTRREIQRKARSASIDLQNKMELPSDESEET